MKIIKKEVMLCTCCMEKHEVATVSIKTKTLYKEKEIEYDAICYYCANADEYYEDEDMISKNDIAMKNAYRKAVGLLTSQEIASIRNKYGISQVDLSALLGWGEKTVTRYEGHQVQDSAHDAILRKIDGDSEWFLSLLKKSESKFSVESYKKYLNKATNLYNDAQDVYLRKAIKSQYAIYEGNPLYNGNSSLDLDKVVDVINYLANSVSVTNLFMVKLVKLLWYIDTLSYKRRNRSITGLVYRALPMGAVPVAYDSLKDLKGIHYEEMFFDDNIGIKFYPSSVKTYKYLDKDDKEVLNDVISALGAISTKDIVDKMHDETAYKKTRPKHIISFCYAKELVAL